MILDEKLLDGIVKESKTREFQQKCRANKYILCFHGFSCIFHVFHAFCHQLLKKTLENDPKMFLF